VADLHSVGWRQGSVFAAELSVTFFQLSAEGQLEQASMPFDRWIVCNQDCELRGAAVESTEAVVEVRPVLDEKPPDDFGIRSRRFKLSGQEYVDGEVPRTHVTPSALNAVRDTREPLLADGRAKAFKTWLSFRYDRPALPDRFVELGREVAKRCETRGGRVVAEKVHDILMQFDETETPPQVALYAVIADDANPEVVRQWLAAAASRVRTDLGVISGIDVGTKAEISLALVENTYAADLTQLTWRGQEPTGAT
jgi:hypothetical protein